MNLTKLIERQKKEFELLARKTADGCLEPGVLVQAFKDSLTLAYTEGRKEAWEELEKARDKLRPKKQHSKFTGEDFFFSHRDEGYNDALDDLCSITHRPTSA